MYRIATVILPLAALAIPAGADEQLSFPPPFTLSIEGGTGATPGEAASKVKLVQLFNTPGGVNNGRLVAVYADANSPSDIWHPRDGERRARDIFVRTSDDDGATWTSPLNLSNTAAHFSAHTDWSGDGLDEPYWGDSGKPSIFSAGNNIVVSWSDKYCPEATWAFGQNGDSTIQGTVLYPDLNVYPNQREVPYAGVWLAISTDGGTTWSHGGTNPPLQLTYGRRDTIQDNIRGSGPRWIVTWQEDPEGLQPGEADGPGEGASGAKVTQGTDIWYTWTEDLVANAPALRTNRTPLSDNSIYDLTGTNGFPLVGNAGANENHGASRPNLAMVKVGNAFHGVVAYEETKGIPDVVEGKTVQYHSFSFDQPIKNGGPNATVGAPGTALTDLIENSRRVRFVPQSPTGTNPAMVIFWRQGLDTEGGPGDIMCKVATAIDEATVLAAPTVNLSANTPNATPGDLQAGTQDNPLEDARAHRALSIGPFIAVGYSYTWNGPLARYTDLANYDFWMRRSFDAGQTWEAPRNLSNIEDTKINVLEPRLVKPSNTGTQDPNVFVIGWGTETNVYEGLQTSEPLDMYITRTSDRGETYGNIARISAYADPDFESQLRMNDDASVVHATWMHHDKTLGTTNAVYGAGHLLDVPPSVGTLFCFGNGTGADCPCGNASDPSLGEGCANSGGVGAQLIGTGSASLASADLAMNVSQVAWNQPAVLALSTAAVDGLLGVPFSDGLLCLASPFVRFAIVQTGVSGTGSWGPDLLAGQGLQPGDRAYFQVWYRDPPGPCGFASNVSNAVEVLVLP